MTSSSLEVFMKFVRYLEPTSDSTAAARLDVRGVLSRECFETWLQTRHNIIQHPEQAFHRILLCHLRGSDTRKPFPPEVEAAIIELLRTEEASALWDRCFNGNLLKVGKHGFRGLGYHEKLAAVNDSPRVGTSSDNNRFEFDPEMRELCLPSSNDRKDYKLPKLNVGDQNQIDIFQTPKPQMTLSHSNRKRKSLFEELIGKSYLSDSNIYNMSFKDMNNLKWDQVHLQGTVSFPSLQNALRPKLWPAITGELEGSTPWERLREAAERFHRYDDSMLGLDRVISELIKQLVAFKTGSSSSQLVCTNNGNEASFNMIDILTNKLGKQMFAPAVVYMLQQSIPVEYDKRFDPSFIFPKADHCYFTDDKPVGCWRTDPLSGTICEISDEAKVLLRGDYSGMYMFSPLASLFYFWYTCSLKMPQNNDWIRTHLLRRDGTIGLFLLKLTLCSNHSHVIYFQDISDDHPDVLGKPFLI